MKISNKTILSGLLDVPAQEKRVELRPRIPRFGEKCELALDHFAGGVLHPSMILGMGAGGLVSSRVRLGALKALANSPWGRFLGAPGSMLTAASVAWVSEVPAIYAASRSLEALLHPEAKGGNAAQEMKSLAWMLGSLRIGGSLFRGLFNLGHGVYPLSGSIARGAALTRISHPLSGQLGMFTGLNVYYALGNKFGFHEELDGKEVLTRSLTTLLQFNFAGALAQGVLGQRYLQALRGMEQQILFLKGDFHFPQSLWNPMMVTPEGFQMVMKPHPNTVLHSRGAPGAKLTSKEEAPFSAYEIIQKLVSKRDLMARKGMRVPRLHELVAQEVREGRIPEARLEELRFGAYNRELFERVPELQKISQRELSDPHRAVLALVGIQAKVEKGRGEGSVTLPTLMQALVFGGKIPHGKMRQFVQRAGTYQLYQVSPLLKEGFEKSDFKDRFILVSRLRQLRPRYARQMGHDYGLTTMADALSWNPSFPGKRLREILITAASSEFVENLPLEELRITPQRLRKMKREAVFLRLLRIKPRILSKSDPNTNYSIGYILEGLKVLGLNSFADGPVNDAALGQAYTLDQMLRRWDPWGPHFALLAKIPKSGRFKGWSRIRYARQHFFKEDGGTYQLNRLHEFVRWGTFLWRHRRRIGLRTPEVPPLEVNTSDLKGKISKHMPKFVEEWDFSKPEEVFRGLLQLRPQLMEEVLGKVPENRAEAAQWSLDLMVKSLANLRKGKRFHSLEIYARTLDLALQHWHHWAGHFRNMLQMPLRRGPKGGTSRLDYAQENIKFPDGQAVPESTLKNLMRWGPWLYENQEKVPLRLGKESSWPPPPAGE